MYSDKIFIMDSITSDVDNIYGEFQTHKVCCLADIPNTQSLKIFPKITGRDNITISDVMTGSDVITRSYVIIRVTSKVEVMLSLNKISNKL
jgi:hypothetical protein